SLPKRITRKRKMVNPMPATPMRTRVCMSIGALDSTTTVVPGAKVDEGAPGWVEDVVAKPETGNVRAAVRPSELTANSASPGRNTGERNLATWVLLISLPIEL